MVVHTHQNPQHNVATEIERACAVLCTALARPTFHFCCLLIVAFADEHVVIDGRAEPLRHCCTAAVIFAAWRVAFGLTKVDFERG